MRHVALTHAALALAANRFCSLEGETPEGTEAAAPAANPTPTPEKVTKPAKAKKAKPVAKKAKAKKAKPSGKSGANKGVKGPQVLKQYAPDYRKGGPKGDSKTSGGNKAVDNGDAVANKLLGKSLNEVYELAVPVLNKGLEEGEKEWTVGTLKAKYKHLNVGMQRMNIGNRMRAVLGLTKASK